MTEEEKRTGAADANTRMTMADNTEDQTTETRTWGDQKQVFAGGGNPPNSQDDDVLDNSHRDGRLVRVALILSIIALLGVMFVMFTGNQQVTPAPIQPVALTSADGTSIEGTRVAFVRVDSVQNNYLMTIHFLDSIERRFKSMERDLTGKQRELQRKVQNYYRDIQSGVLQEAMALRIKEQIEKEGDQLAALEEGYSNRITDLQLQLNIIYFDTLWNFLGRHKETFGVDMVVGYQQGLTNIFFADQALDLTAPVIELLNAEYAEKHPGRKSKNKR